MREVLLRSLGAVSAERELAATAGLLERTARERGRLAGALQIAELRGRAVALGRFQAARPCALRRATGGHAVGYGDGVLSLVLALPGAAAWLDAPLPSLDRLLNRYVRGLLDALRSLGLAAAYPGRDVATVTGHPVALLGVERDARGVCLVQAVLGVGARVAPTPLAGWPGAERSPLAGARALAELEAAPADLPARLPGALSDAYRRRYGLAFVEAPADSAERAASVALATLAPESTLVPGPALAIAIGTLRAAVRLDAAGGLAEAHFESEWIADSPGVAALERAVVGAPLEAGALRARVAPVLASADHFALGLGAPERVVEALLAAGVAARGVVPAGY